MTSILLLYLLPLSSAASFGKGTVVVGVKSLNPDDCFLLDEYLQEDCLVRIDKGLVGIPWWSWFILSLVLLVIVVVIARMIYTAWQDRDKIKERKERRRKHRVQGCGWTRKESRDSTEMQTYRRQKGGQSDFGPPPLLPPGASVLLSGGGGRSSLSACPDHHSQGLLLLQCPPRQAVQQICPPRACPCPGRGGAPEEVAEEEGGYDPLAGGPLHCYCTSAGQLLSRGHIASSVEYPPTSSVEYPPTSSVEYPPASSVEYPPAQYSTVQGPRDEDKEGLAYAQYRQSQRSSIYV